MMKLAQSSTPPPTHYVRHYEILKQLGAGGMGVVHLAHDHKLNRKVALKFVLAGMLERASSRKRFMHEARAAAQLDHPNIGTIYNVEETDDGELFIVMAYYEGQTLEQRLKEATLSNEDVLSIACQVAKGLVHAHQQDVVHRDVKPANIFLSRDGLVKILDFGIAQHNEPQGLTQDNAAAGTIDYMSPEQLRGQETDHRTDIWALGVLLYEMLTAQTPFGQGHNVAGTILQIISKEASPVHDLRPDALPAFEQILALALAKPSHERYSSVTEFLADLEHMQRCQNETHASTNTKTDNT